MHMMAVLLVSAAITAALAADAAAGVRVLDDEVYFTITAPGAEAVYLVGDFNNWNATMEKMERTGDAFEISLYLVEGSYRYKFVVDGRWIVDPENPGDPTRGSPLVLVEKPAGLMLLTVDPEEEKAVPSLSPWFRYISQLRWNPPGEDDFDDWHLANLGLSIQREHLRGMALLQATSDTWNASGEPRHYVAFDRGFVGTDVGGLDLDAFTDHSSVWTSQDPVSVVGNVGVFDYNAGYNRNGVSFDYRFSEPIHFKGFYADDMGELPGRQAAIWSGGILAASSGADTIAYEYDTSTADSDVIGLELSIASSGYQGGIVGRYNYGMYPGTMADVSIADSAAIVYNTRRNTGVSFAWLRISKLFGLGVSAGYGRGRADVHQLTREEQAVYPPRILAATQLSSPDDTQIEFETSDRFYAALDYARGAAKARVDWDRVTFDFDGGVYQPSEATVDRVHFDFDWRESEWSAGLRLDYIRQDYGNTPEELQVDSPLLNMWLDWRDEFDVADIVGLGAASWTDLVVTGEWAPGWGSADADTLASYRPRTWPGTEDWVPPLLRFEAGTTADGFFDSLGYTRARLTLTYLFAGRWYAMADGRAAAYDIEEWGAATTYLSGYVEAGFLYRWFNVNLGWGFDPVIFDPVVSDYMDIGRTRVLRHSLAGGVSRDRAADIGRSLLEFEKLLQNVQTIKLEVVVYF